jgi:hypothetical protein
MLAEGVRSGYSYESHYTRGPIGQAQTQECSLCIKDTGVVLVGLSKAQSFIRSFEVEPSSLYTTEPQDKMRSSHIANVGVHI